MADDIEAPHDGMLEVDADSDAIAVARALLRSGLLAYTSNATWSVALGEDQVVFGRGWVRSFTWPVGQRPLSVTARDVDAIHARYWAQANPRDILAKLSGKAT